MSLAAAAASPTSTLDRATELSSPSVSKHRDLEHPADRRHVAEPGHVISAGDGLVALPTEPTEPPGFGSLLRLVRIMPQAHGPGRQWPGATGTAIGMGEGAASGH